MFGTATVTMLVLLLVASVVLRQAPLVALALTLLLAAGLSRVYERHCLTGLEYRRRLSRREVPFGETVVLETEVVNRKVLPLAWLEVDEEVSDRLRPVHGHILPSPKPGRAVLRGLFAIRPYERVRRRYVIPGLGRGEHTFGPARVRAGDLFGLVTREVVLGEYDTVIVYPRVVPLTALGLPAQQPLGNLRTQSWIFEDPSRMAGAREYRPGDSLRRIHWPASVRAQRLHTRVYEPTTRHRLAILLDLVSTPQPWWSLTYDPDALELAIMSAASIAAWGFAQGYDVGIATNGKHRLARTTVRIAPSGDPALLPRMLAALGRLQPFAVQPFEAVVEDEMRQAAHGTTLVAVSAAIATPGAAALRAARRRGHPVVLVHAGRYAPGVPLDGIVVRQVGPPEGWSELPSLTLAGQSAPPALRPVDGSATSRTDSPLVGSR